MKYRLIAFSLLLFLLFLSSCSKPASVVSAKDDIDYYTCTMHPWVHSKKPGACPVCGMDLVPVNKIKPAGEQANQIPANLKPVAQRESHEFEVPKERQQQFGVTYAEVKRERLRHSVRTVGLVTADKGRQWMYVPCTDGYVKSFMSPRPVKRSRPARRSCRSTVRTLQQPNRN